jgi:hypothetical protein
VVSSTSCRQLLGIGLVVCQQVLGWNPPGLGALGYTNKFTKDDNHKCEEASLEFPHEVFLGKKIINLHQLVFMCDLTQI